MPFCASCGKETPNGQTFCKECNNTIAGAPSCAPAPRKQKRNSISIICFIAAGLIFILSLLGGIQIGIGADRLSNLSSVSGNTVAEFFYNGCGTVFGGLGLFVIAFGLFAGAFLTYCGYKNIKK